MPLLLYVLTTTVLVQYLSQITFIQIQRGVQKGVPDNKTGESSLLSLAFYFCIASLFLSLTSLNNQLATKDGLSLALAPSPELKIKLSHLQRLGWQQANLQARNQVRARRYRGTWLFRL